ncbi:Splicing factor 3A subunit 3 [Morella rubra]|uniref:Splicing factor 3A subunit 3 n=1 Tax=Morella rubra TaxID=262757 RepID=A0A6A1UX85_9ROSI|nr:Splicing factor 3A subunit 3 [Morella rubra]
MGKVSESVSLFVEALAAIGLKTGGTVQQRAERLFLTKHTPLEKLDKKHFAKGARVSEQNRAAAAPQQDDSSKEIALQEAKMKKLCDLLDETIARTKDNIVKKQALTYEEIEAEREEEETQADTESDDDEQQIYNPLKLPMGWDGKPIPYWLYKLHGLGQEFKCEICGNYSYWGRRAFERHFKEWRHQHGMRCLGIPNTKNFNEITSIEEAKDLWKKIQERQGVNKWRPDLEEEYEDREGNIYNKKTYTDLQRQGLI